MKIDVFDIPQIPFRLRRNTPIVVVDPIYTASSIVTALYHGAREVIPVADPGMAAQIARRIGTSQCLLAGSDDHRVLPGFTLGDNPGAFSREKVSGKSIVLYADGVQAILRAKEADKTYIGSFLNAEAVAQAVADQEEIVLLCAGTQGRFSLDDILCCGSLIFRILRLSGDRQLCDLGRTALALYNSYHDRLFEVLQATQAIDKLCRQDQNLILQYCFSEDEITLVPVFEEGTIRAETENSLH